MAYITCSIAWITSNHSFRPAIDFVVAQLPVTVADQVVHAAHEQPDGLAAGLLALDPGDLIASDVLGRVALLADQLAVRELAGVVQGAHLVADLLPSLLAQEVVHHADAVLVHARHDVLQRQLQRRQRLRLPVGPQAAAVAQPLARRVTRRVQVRLLLVRRRAGQRLLLPGLRRALAAVAALAHELVLLPVLPLVLLAAVEGAAAAAAAQQVLHLPAQLAVLPVSLARTRPAGPTAVIGHGGGGGG